MTNEQTERLEGMSGIGKPLTHKNKDGSGWTRMGTVEDEVFERVGEYKHLIQRIRLAQTSWDGCEYAYRTGYYTYDRNLKNIKWGQYSQFLTQKAYRELL